MRPNRRRLTDTGSAGGQCLHRRICLHEEIPCSVRCVQCHRADMTWAASDKDLVPNAHFVELLHDVLRVLRPVISIDLP